MSEKFEDSDFDPIAYLNARFPDEESLAGLDDEIQKLNKELSSVNQELVEEIHQHAIMNIQISEEINKAKALSKEIISEIGVIKDKAKKSEEIVYDMCKDLKSLDIAKKNLTFSIDSLKKFIMMVDAIEKLSDACQNRNYAQVADLISAFNELSNHFKKYEQIPQIQELYTYRNNLIEELYAQITEDFQAYYNESSPLSEENMRASCKVLAILEDKYWRNFSITINQIILKQYDNQYGAPQNSQLENTEKRYGFIRRKIQDFKKKFDNVFPEEWGMECLLLYEFCSITRLHITNALEKSVNTVNVAILMKSLESSLKFESKITDLMAKRYGHLIKNPKKQKNCLHSLPKFIGAISNSFQPYLKPYIKSEEDALYDALQKSLEDDKVTEIKVYNSSIVLFHGIKNSIRRASNYSKGNLLLDILKVVKRVLRAYGEKCVEKAKKSCHNFEENICWIINTAQYCKNMIEGVQECFESSIDPLFAENLDFSEENECFSNAISRSIQTFISSLEQKLEVSFTKIMKMSSDNWKDAVQNDGVSPYISEAKETLKTNFVKIKSEMESLYLTLYMDKVVVLVANKIIQSIYKCKKLPQEAFQALQMDITEIKLTLLELIKTDQKTYSNEKIKKKYEAFVAKTFQKGENLIKLLSMPNEPFAGQFQSLMEGAGTQELEKILQVKGAKKADFPNLVKSIQNKKF